MSDRLRKCPHCGSEESFTIKQHNVTLVYSGIFGSEEEPEHTNMDYYSPPPKNARCDSCGRRIPLKNLEGAGVWGDVAQEGQSL